MQHDGGWKAAPVLGVPDVLRTAAFFRSVLGFECPEERIFRGVGDEGGVYAIARRGDTAVHIQIRRRPLDLDDRQDHECDAYLNVADVDALYHEYLKTDVKFHRGLQDEAYGMRDFTIQTPDGHRIAFATAKPA